MQSWTPLEHRIFRLLKAHKMEGADILVAVSGGADSMGLLYVLKELESALKLKIRVAHIHHGPGEWKAFRDRAEKMVRQACGHLKVPLTVVHSDQELRSEQELRRFRRNALLELAAGSWIFTGHHLQDLLETRLIRLIRGTGPQGLRAISIRSKPWFRPWLTTTTQEIRQELAGKHQDFWEDPSNRDLGPLRNWIRQEWLPALESKRPGALRALGRSLENLAKAKDEKLDQVFLAPGVLSRGLFHALGASQKQQVLARCLLNVVGLNYSSGQIEEIKKRLDNPKNQHSFRMRNSLWQVNAEQISLKKVSQK